MRCCVLCCFLWCCVLPSWAVLCGAALRRVELCRSPCVVFCLPPPPQGAALGVLRRPVSCRVVPCCVVSCVRGCAAVGLCLVVRCGGVLRLAVVFVMSCAVVLGCLLRRFLRCHVLQCGRLVWLFGVPLRPDVLCYLRCVRLLRPPAPPSCYSWCCAVPCVLSCCA